MIRSRYIPVIATIVSIAAPVCCAAASSPFGIATPDSPTGNGLAGPLGPLLLGAIHLQTLFYQKLTSNLQTMTADPHAGLWLISVSFLYGIFHAVGPGHGKAIISSFVLATGERLKQAVMLSIVASLLQAVSAIAIVFAAAVVLDLTAAEITSVTDDLETGSYALVVLLGLALAVSKARLLVKVWRPDEARSGFSCDGYANGVSAPAADDASLFGHVHGLGCSCAAVRDLAAAKVQVGRKERLQAIISIGIRPCSGALIILVFALAQHLALPGIISVFAMAAGTAFTVGTIATIAVVARGFLARLSLLGGAVAPRMAAASQLAAAFALLLFGVMMLAGLLVTNGRW